jgi:hypothetical protein
MTSRREIIMTAAEAEADWQRASVRLAELGEAGVTTSLHPPLSKAAEARFEACRQCDHFNDDANTGEPLSPPCGLNREWSICRWKGAAIAGEPPADRRCPWHRLADQPAKAEVFGLGS